MKGFENKEVLITGAAGFIGANLTKKMLGLGAKVNAIVKPTTDLRRIKAMLSNINLFTLDLIDDKALKITIAEIKPRFIFNCASPGGHPNLEEQSNFLKSCVLGTNNLLRSVKDLNIQCFVHLGSSLEYGIKEKPIKETDRLNPHTYRGVAKAASTLLCQQFAQAFAKPIVVLRPFSVYGYFESQSRLIPSAIKAVLNKQEMDLTDYGCFRDFIFIDDLVKACVLAAKNKQLVGQIINIGSGVQHSNEEVVDMVQNICGQKIKVNVGVYSNSPSDTSFWVADISKAKKLLNWQPNHSLEEGIRKTITWFKEGQSHAS